MMTILRRQQNERAVTMQQIADRCGVSRQTVSRSFVHDPRIGEATRQRVLAMAQEMGYDPLYHQGARRMALIKAGQDVITTVIGLFFPPFQLRSRYADEIFWGCWDTVTREGFSLALFPSCDPETLKDTSLPLCYTRGDVDGLIVLANPSAFKEMFAHLQGSLQRKSQPIVFVTEEWPDYSAVLIDDHGGAYAALSHLLQLGHRHIVHFYPQEFLLDHPHAQRRFAGYQQAVQDSGHATACHLQALPWWWNQDKKYLDQLVHTLRESPEITAILARNDKQALQIISALRECGWSVPGDYSVVGFDDTEQFIGSDNTNWLTTVRAPLMEVGRTAGKMIIDEVLGRKSAGIETVTLDTLLVVRQTTAQPRKL